MSVDPSDRRLLAGALGRVPAGDYERRAKCGVGWWPVVARLDRRLTAISPDYEVHGVGSVDGALVYHAAPKGPPEPACCTTWVESNPPPPDSTGAAEWSDWLGRRHSHSASDDHVDPLRLAFFALIDEAVRQSMVTCEACGQPGKWGLDARGNAQTRCDDCENVG
ncbi:MAG: hypothetical protein QM628_15710 [Propionicimonas sp.]